MIDIGKDLQAAFDGGYAARDKEIVRCRECEYFDRIEPNHPYGYCHAAKHGYQTSRWEISIYRKCKDDFYCADGERKDGETDGQTD